MAPVVRAVACVVGSALIFSLAFGENPLSRLLPELSPFALEPTIVTTSVEQALSSFEAETLLQATVVTMTDLATEASEYAHNGYDFPLGGHYPGDGS